MMNKIFFIIILVIATSLFSSGCSNIDDNGDKILFVSERDGNPEIYIMDADGGNPVNLTNNAAKDYAPSWSPDGKMIAFTSERDGKSEIYIMKANGSEQINISNNDYWDYYPQWSPDGKYIAFVSNRRGIFDINMVNYDGSNLKRIIYYAGLDFSWSPDGKQIACSSDIDNHDISRKEDIFLVDIESLERINLTNSSVYLERSPKWLSNGEKLVFLRYINESGIIYITDKDGSNQHKLDIASSSAQSSFQNSIVFRTDFDDSFSDEWLIINKNGSKVKTINIPLDSFYDDFVILDNGNKLVFVSFNLNFEDSLDFRVDIDSAIDINSMEIYTINLDGSNLQRLTSNNISDRWPSWSP